MSSTFLITTRRGELNAVRYRGILLTESYEQLQSLLRKNLSQKHALFLAEPLHSAKGDSTDWYAALSGKVELLNSLPEEEKASASRIVSGIASDIAALAATLKNSGIQANMVRGEILELVLSHADEKYLYMVGEQPVLVCWGVEVDRKSDPQALIRLGERISAPKETDDPVAPPELPADTPPEQIHRTQVCRPPFPWKAALACFILGVLLLLLPFIASEAFRPLDLLHTEEQLQATEEERELVRELTALRERKDTLLVQLTDLRMKLDTVLAMCIPLPGFKPGDRLRIPQAFQERGDVRFLKGCWNSGEDAVETNSGLGVISSSGARVSLRYCFNAKGSGEIILTEQPGGKTWTGTMSAAFDENGRLIITESGLNSDSGERAFSPSQTECTRGDQDFAECYGINPNQRSHKWGADFVRAPK